MKYLKFAAIVLILFFLGYVLGPTLNPMLVKEQEPENHLKVAVKYRGATYEIDLAEYRGTDLPEILEIRKLAMIPTVGGEGEAKLRVGDKVKLLNKKDNKLIVETMDGIGKGSISPLSTDIYEALAQKKYDDEAAKNGLAAAPTPPIIPADLEPEPQPEPKPMEPVDPVAQVDPDPTPETDPTMPVVEPEPQPEPVGGGDLTEEQIIALMQKSIEGGAVKEFKIDQVKGWKSEEKETVDGTEYQIGMAAYEAATIFGVKPVQAKALIKDGKIERWVYAKSGMEIQ